MKDELQYIGEKIVQNNDLLSQNLVNIMLTHHTQNLLEKY
ncbi:hypothetical protein KP78_29550 [Jeotgalibacillus soli]|uniref:Uncharacterized protein n=1 Tax=Jeotgalibacillus soli TaxID=889306 RepID=A0A0C2VLS0_9BACL|nr:hypothetical protein KP78_29550 [Jeotgalibacillus soli]